MLRLAGITRRLFLILYIIYATSSIIGEVNRMPPNGITADRTTVAIKILNIDRILALFFDSDDSRSEADNEVGDDFLVRKFRSIPRSHSLDKQMLFASHTQSPQLAAQLDSSSLQNSFISHDIVVPTVPEPFEGYGTQHSGLAPPSLLA